MDETELYCFWKKYIDRNLYRVVSSEYLSDIRKNGLNPRKDPYQKIIPKIKRLFKLVMKLEKNGFIHEQDWGLKNKVTGKYIIMVSTEDIDSPLIDFTSDYKETHYYRKHKGGKKGNKYWKSPFGRFEHFKQVVERYGLKKYEDYLKGKRLFYLRVKDRIPAKEIHRIL